MNDKKYVDAITTNSESVRDYVENHKTDLNDDDVTMYSRPKAGCKHCYGIGREGWDWFSGEPKICRCITKRLYIKTNTKYLTWKEFKELMLTKVDNTTRKPKHLTPKTLRRSMGKHMGKYKKLEAAANGNI